MDPLNSFYPIIMFTTNFNERICYTIPVENTSVINKQNIRLTENTKQVTDMVLY